MSAKTLPASALALALGIGATAACEPPPSGSEVEYGTQALLSSSLLVNDPLSIAAGSSVVLQSKLDSRTVDDRGTFLDFMHWGKSGTVVNHARGRAFLPSYALIGTIVPKNIITTNAPMFSWWDGTPDKVASSNGGVYVSNKTFGFKITIPAPPVPNELACALYGQVVATVPSTGTVSFALADKTAPAVSKTVMSGQPFRLDYQFGSRAATNLTISYTLTNDPAGNAKVVLYANKCNWVGDQPFLVTPNPGTGADPFPRFKSGWGFEVVATEVTGGPYTSVEFYEDGKLVDTQSAQPWRVVTLPPPGLHYYQVQGTRSDGRKVQTGAYRVPVWIPSVLQPNLSIPDNNSTGITVDLPISAAPTGLQLADVVFSLQVTHSYDQDLRIDAIGPGGARITLASGVGGSDNDYNNTRFWDLAAVAINAGEPDAVPPFDAQWGYRPQQSTSLLGKTVNGTWKLNVADLDSLDVGVLNWARVFVLPN
jgi:subtilisin-like proprotein convertase family protein